MKRANLFTIAVFYFVTISNPLYAQSNPLVIRLDKEKTVLLALQASEDFKIAENQTGIIRQQYKEAVAALYPQVSGASTWAHNVEYPGTTIKDYDVSSGVSVNQLLWAFGRVSSALTVARKAILVSSLDKEAARQEIAYIAKQAYYATLFAKEMFNVVEASYENTVSNKTILEERSAKGRVSKRDNIKISADGAARIPQVNNARAQLKSMTNTLKTIIGVSQDMDIEFLEDFSEAYYVYAYDELEGKMFRYEPTLKSLEANVELKKSIIKQKIAEYFPYISAFGSYLYKGSDDNTVPASGNIDSYGVIGVKVNVPIFTGGATTARVKQSKMNKDIAELQFEKEKKALALQLRNAISDYNEFVENLSANNTAVKLAEESFALVQELFASGQVSVTDLNDAELQLTTQKLARLQTLFNINVTFAKIEKLTEMEETV